MVKLELVLSVISLASFIYKPFNTVGIKIRNINITTFNYFNILNIF